MQQKPQKPKRKTTQGHIATLLKDEQWAKLNSQKMEIEALIDIIRKVQQQRSNYDKYTAQLMR